MLDFLNDSKLSPNNSFCLEQEKDNVLREIIFSPSPEPFPLFQEKEEAQEFEPEE